MTDENIDSQQATDSKRRSGPSVNKVILIGRLAADPDLRYTADGKPVAHMRLATNNGPDRADFHSLVAFGQQAQFAGEYLTKGRLVYAEGRLQTRSWETPEGQRRYATEVLTNSLQALGPRRARDDAEREEPEHDSAQQEAEAER